MSVRRRRRHLADRRPLIAAQLVPVEACFMVRWELKSSGTSPQGPRARRCSNSAQARSRGLKECAMENDDAFERSRYRIQCFVYGDIVHDAGKMSGFLRWTAHNEFENS